MRRIAAQLQMLGPVHFILVIASVAGAIQALPRLFLSGTVSPLQLVPFLIIGATGILWWTAAFLLWWVAARRDQSSLWIVAAQVTLGLLIAEFFAGALGLVADSISTNGKVATFVAQHLLDVILSNLFVTLLRSPLWFLGSALAIALGRHLNGGSQPLPAAISARSHPGAVM